MNLKDFDALVGRQLETMDKLLDLQGEIERCQELKEQLNNLPGEACGEIQEEIEIMKEELQSIQKVFQKQTEEVIRSYQIKEPLHK
ncbi:YgaB family protein [Metabacillus indicus]|uniref:YgaB family protein n=1 Tax=Metabacillus indicus TaxID=246786 RepID=UPI00248FCA0F|nr:YgaB family protein [Metabacillus indicus]